MTIHDELLWALTQVDNKGMTPIHEMLGSDNFTYQVEEHKTFRDSKTALTYQMVPDIIVNAVPFEPRKPRYLIMEVENHLQWDFSDSLRQIKKYKTHLKMFGEQAKELVVIIPEIYDRFTPMYQNEEINVWTWEASRIWECLECNHKWVDKRSLKESRCPRKGCGKTSVRLAGLLDFILREKQGAIRIIRRMDDNLKHEVEASCRSSS